MPVRIQQYSRAVRAFNSCLTITICIVMFSIERPIPRQLLVRLLQYSQTLLFSVSPKIFRLDRLFQEEILKLLTH